VKLPGKSISLQTAEFADLRKQFAAAESFLRTSQKVEFYDETRHFTDYEYTTESTCTGSRRVRRPVEKTVTNRKAKTVQSHDIDMDAFAGKWRSKLGDVIDELERVMMAVIETQLEAMSTQVVQQYQTHHDQYCAIITRETETLEGDIKAVESRQHQLQNLERRVKNAANDIQLVYLFAATECNNKLNHVQTTILLLDMLRVILSLPQILGEARREQGCPIRHIISFRGCPNCKHGTYYHSHRFIASIVRASSPDRAQVLRNV
jgi:hypothetical protein